LLLFLSLSLSLFKFPPGALLWCVRCEDFQKKLDPARGKKSKKKKVKKRGESYHKEEEVKKKKKKG
jgi:hypothetical protein